MDLETFVVDNPRPVARPKEIFFPLSHWWDRLCIFLTRFRLTFLGRYYEQTQARYFPQAIPRGHRRRSRRADRRARAQGVRRESACDRWCRDEGTQHGHPTRGEWHRASTGRGRSLDSGLTTARSSRPDRHEDRLRPRRMRSLYGVAG